MDLISVLYHAKSKNWLMQTHEFHMNHNVIYFHGTHHSKQKNLFVFEVSASDHTNLVTTFSQPCQVVRSLGFCCAFFSLLQNNFPCIPIILNRANSFVSSALINCFSVFCVCHPSLVDSLPCVCVVLLHFPYAFLQVVCMFWYVYIHGMQYGTNLVHACRCMHARQLCHYYVKVCVLFRT
jgi:hypothetical protein